MKRGGLNEAKFLNGPPSSLSNSLLSTRGFQPRVEISFLFFKKNEREEGFRDLVNGVFQAEGHIGGYFPSVPTITFRPLVYISQNASDSSIEFLVIL
jgi:hypothetical protein